MSLAVRKGDLIYLRKVSTQVSLGSLDTARHCNFPLKPCMLVIAYKRISTELAIIVLT